MVTPGPYKGTFGTMWSIVSEEGTREQIQPAITKPESIGAPTVWPGVKKTTKKGQGIGGLWRGWRVGMWGLVGVWGAGALGGAGTGGEF